jgi:superfamily I DNA/RNA helicase
VKYRLVGSQSYFDRREVKDVLAFLKVMLNPDDDISSASHRECSRTWTEREDNADTFTNQSGSSHVGVCRDETH